MSLVNDHDLKVGDRVVCIDDSGYKFLTKGKQYTVEKVLIGGGIQVDLNNSLYNHSKFKRVESKPQEPKTEKDLFMAGGVVVCLDSDKSVGTLELGKLYVIERVGSTKLDLVGVEASWNKDRFKVDPTNNPEQDEDIVPLEWLVEFRELGEMNQVIIGQKIYWSVKFQDWLCNGKDTQGWVKYIQGAWRVFHEFKTREAK